MHNIIKILSISLFCYKAIASFPGAELDEAGARGVIARKAQEEMQKISSKQQSDLAAVQQAENSRKLQELMKAEEKARGQIEIEKAIEISGIKSSGRPFINPWFFAIPLDNRLFKNIAWTDGSKVAGFEIIFSATCRGLLQDDAGNKYAVMRLNNPYYNEYYGGSNGKTRKTLNYTEIPENIFSNQQNVSILNGYLGDTTYTATLSKFHTNVKFSIGKFQSTSLLDLQSIDGRYLQDGHLMPVCDLTNIVPHR